ncbi:MAG: hypothetical protein KAG20_02005 [Cocleimonas sp.]|nr:hypothetical protein [Cocleimonas sp.]
MHITYHFIVPAIIVGLFFRPHWKFAYFILIATLLVDADHLLAHPIYDPTRCSIGFHPLHRFFPIVFYLVLSFLPKPRAIRLIGIGLVTHMLLDSIDCQTTNGVWWHLPL